MGLFSFLKNAGASLFKGKVAEPEAKEQMSPETALAIKNQKEILLKGLVEGMKLGVQNLQVELHDDVVTVYGEADSQSDREKIILTLGNVDGIASVDDRMTVAVQEPEAVFYEVQKGDTLSKISKEHYGSPNKYMVIFEANKPMLKDPDLIYPGQMLRIPPLAEA